MSNILLKALNQCADKFQQYVEHHEKNGHSEKAVNNRLMVSMIREAIANYTNFGDYTIPLRIIEIDQHLVDLKRVQVVSPLDKGKFSLTMVSGIDAHCSDPKMYEDVKQAYRDYMKWEQGLDVPSVTTVKAVGDIISLKSEVGQVKPECKIDTNNFDGLFTYYYVGSWKLAYVIENGMGEFVLSLLFQLDQENVLEMLQAKYFSFEEADKVARETITSYYNRLFA